MQIFLQAILVVLGPGNSGYREGIKVEGPGLWPTQQTPQGVSQLWTEMQEWNWKQRQPIAFWKKSYQQLLEEFLSIKQQNAIWISLIFYHFAQPRVKSLMMETLQKDPERPGPGLTLLATLDLGQNSDQWLSTKLSVRLGIQNRGFKLSWNAELPAQLYQGKGLGYFWGCFDAIYLIQINPDLLIILGTACARN